MSFRKCAAGARRFLCGAGKNGHDDEGDQDADGSREMGILKTTDVTQNTETSGSEGEVIGQQVRNVWTGPSATVTEVGVGDGADISVPGEASGKINQMNLTTNQSGTQTTKQIESLAATSAAPQTAEAVEPPGSVSNVRRPFSFELPTQNTNESTSDHGNSNSTHEPNIGVVREGPAVTHTMPAPHPQRCPALVTFVEGVNRYAPYPPQQDLPALIRRANKYATDQPDSGGNEARRMGLAQDLQGSSGDEARSMGSAQEMQGLYGDKARRTESGLNSQGADGAFDDIYDEGEPLGDRITHEPTPNQAELNQGEPKLDQVEPAPTQGEPTNQSEINHQSHPLNDSNTTATNDMVARWTEQQGRQQQDGYSIIPAAEDPTTQTNLVNRNVVPHREFRRRVLRRVRTVFRALNPLNKRRLIPRGV